MSRRVVQEAARARVPQIIASRRQVDIGGGYTGWDQAELVHEVGTLSLGQTRLVRDHGGPNGEDDGVASLDADVVAHFDGLHIDVCRLDDRDQDESLRYLVLRYGDQIDWLEVGDERARTSYRNVQLARLGRQYSDAVRVGVVQLGSRIHADRQRGRVVGDVEIGARLRALRGAGVLVKLHNADWLGCRRELPVDFINIAPELALVETDAWLRTMHPCDAELLLDIAYRSSEWARWFDSFEGTYADRARCAVRYVLETDAVRKLTDPYDDTPVRRAIRDAIDCW